MLLHFACVLEDLDLDLAYTLAWLSRSIWCVVDNDLFHLSWLLLILHWQVHLVRLWVNWHSIALVLTHHLLSSIECHVRVTLVHRLIARVHHWHVGVLVAIHELCIVLVVVHSLPHHHVWLVHCWHWWRHWCLSATTTTTTWLSVNHVAVRRWLSEFMISMCIVALISILAVATVFVVGALCCLEVSMRWRHLVKGSLWRAHRSVSNISVLESGSTSEVTGSTSALETSSSSSIIEVTSHVILKATWRAHVVVEVAVVVAPGWHLVGAAHEIVSSRVVGGWSAHGVHFLVFGYWLLSCKTIFNKNILTALGSLNSCSPWAKWQASPTAQLPLFWKCLQTLVLYLVLTCDCCYCIWLPPPNPVIGCMGIWPVFIDIVC